MFETSTNILGSHYEEVDASYLSYITELDRWIIEEIFCPGDRFLIREKKYTICEIQNKNGEKVFLCKVQ